MVRLARDLGVNRHRLTETLDERRSKETTACQVDCIRVCLQQSWSHQAIMEPPETTLVAPRRMMFRILRSLQNNATAQNGLDDGRLSAKLGISPISLLQQVLKAVSVEFTQLPDILVRCLDLPKVAVLLTRIGVAHLSARSTSSRFQKARLSRSQVEALPSLR